MSKSFCYNSKILDLAKINLVLHKLQYCYIYPFQLAKIVRMHNGKMNAIMLAIVEMEAAFATLASKDTNVKWNVRPTIQPPTPLSFRGHTLITLACFCLFMTN